ncbi:hypothetical protein [Moraxella cuniculi]|uniref:hypothetical protein n=1 Tax=Moraxella cuniculi TaxID=34061 RepID=UPI000970E942|nr:hypothetical protein [Moraxella cuniculi]OOS05367.1 hypothetical protein B0189_07105 [Moraxella cuniculi]
MLVYSLVDLYYQFTLMHKTMPRFCVLPVAFSVVFKNNQPMQSDGMAITSPMVNFGFIWLLFLPIMAQEARRLWLIS